jgi:hypothetical protein
MENISGYVMFYAFCFIWGMFNIIKITISYCKEIKDRNSLSSDGASVNNGK